MRSLSPEDLEAAKSFLAKLTVKDGTVVTDPSLIFALDGSGAIETALDRNDPSSAETIVSTVKAVQNALCFLEKVALQGLARIRTEISAFGKDYAGIDDLPNELLVDILRRVRVRGSIDPLLGTSRSIRKRITNLPEFWTDISTKKNPTNYLEWSKPSDLTVTVCESPIGRPTGQEWNSAERAETSRAKALLSLLGPHSSRWKSFNFRDRVDEVTLMQILAAESYPKIFPHLENIVLAYKVNESRSIQRLQNTDNAAKDFISQWKMPALNHLALRNFIPSEIQGSPTTFYFELDFDEFCGAWDLTRLTTLLSTFKLLRQLKISLHFMYDGRQSQEHSPALLENLERLSLRVEGGSPFFLLAALDSFEAPNLQDISLDIKCDEPDGEEIPRVNALFPDDKSHWPNVRSLIIRMPFLGDDESEELVSSLHIALARLPRLAYLTVRSTYRLGRRADEEILSQPGYRSPKLLVHPSLRENRSPFPPLVYLSLHRCPFDITFFTDHADIFNSPRFQMLEIRKCGNIDAIVLRGLLPADKVLSYDGKRILPLTA